MRKILIALLILILIISVGYVNRDNILKIFYPIKYNEYVQKYCKKYGVDEYLIYACIKAESNFKENAESSKGAKGLMQLMYTTAEETAKEINITVNMENIFEPDVNIELGTKYISKLLSKYNNMELALAAYNAGSGKVDSWIADGILKQDGSNIENIPFKETNNYVRKILNGYKVYKKLYDQSYKEG